MLRHVVMYKLKDNTLENKNALVNKFLSMKGLIPELVSVSAGADFIESERSYDVVLETIFEDRDAMARYLEHPVHVGVRDYVRSVALKSHSVDYLFEDPTKEVEEKKSTFAKINLSDGRSMTMELFEEHAPISVENFIKLAKENYFNDLIFHRVIPGFMIQGGGMFESLEAKKGAKAIEGEFMANGVINKLKHTKGTVSMARTSYPNSATSQFFICVDDVPYLDGQYAAFGRLVDDESINIAVDISKVDTHSVGYYDDVPCDPIVIKNIEIFEK